jgi:hypothetical protein
MSYVRPICKCLIFDTNYKILAFPLISIPSYQSFFHLWHQSLCALSVIYNMLSSGSFSISITSQTIAVQSPFPYHQPVLSAWPNEKCFRLPNIIFPSFSPSLLFAFSNVPLFSSLIHILFSFLLLTWIHQGWCNDYCCTHDYLCST